jgi:Plus-3 domain
MICVELLVDVQLHSKHYKINDNVPCNLALELKYGTSVEVFPMDKVSNVDFNEVRMSRRTPRDCIEVRLFRGSLIVLRSPWTLLASSFRQSVN